MPGLVGVNAPSLAASSSWVGRVQQGVYTSPSGARIDFDSEDLSREFELTGTVFRFPQFGGAYVQRTGIGERTYPIRAIFHGADCDIQAARYESALMEVGVGRLAHPLYGVLDVVPFGTVSRRDDLVTAANQAIVDTDFLTTIGSVYPGEQSSGANEIDAWLEQFSTSAAADFASLTSVATLAERRSIITALRGVIDAFGNAFDSVSAVVSGVRRGVSDVADLASAGLDVFIGKPLLLARQIVDLIHSPALLAGGLLDRLEGYSDLLDSIRASASANPVMPGNVFARLAQTRSRLANEFHSADLGMLGAVTGSALAIRTSGTATLRSRLEGVRAASLVLAQLVDATVQRDAAFATLLGIDTVGAFQVDSGSGYAQARSAAVAASRYILAQSFQLLPEREIVLGRDRNVVELVAELMGRIDNATIDAFVDMNTITANEMLLIPRGRKVRYVG